MKRSTLSFNSRCSSVKSKSIPVPFVVVSGHLPGRASSQVYAGCINLPALRSGIQSSHCIGSRMPLRGSGMWISEPEDRFRDDVLLNLVRAAVDRDFAGVEISWRDGRGPIGADRRLIPSLFFFMLLPVRQRVGTDDLHQEFGRRLLDFRALDLEDRGGRIGLALGAPGFRRHHT